MRKASSLVFYIKRLVLAHNGVILAFMPENVEITISCKHLGIVEVLFVIIYCGNEACRHIYTLIASSKRSTAMTSQYSYCPNCNQDLSNIDLSELNGFCPYCGAQVSVQMPPQQQEPVQQVPVQQTAQQQAPYQQQPAQQAAPQQQQTYPDANAAPQQPGYPGATPSAQSYPGNAQNAQYSQQSVPPNQGYQYTPGNAPYPSTAPVAEVVISRKDKLAALLLCIFAGTWGIHRFYVGKIGTGVLWLLTCGCLGIGWLVDIILIASDNFKDKEGALVSRSL